MALRGEDYDGGSNVGQITGSMYSIQGSCLDSTEILQLLAAYKSS